MDLYVEPFVGAGAVFLDLAPDHAIVNDANALLIETYRAIADDPERVIEALGRHVAAHGKTYFYETRAIDRSDDFASWPAAERAARLIYLNKTCYNGLYRVNIKGHFNVPYGRYAKPAFPEADEIRAISGYLRRTRVKLRCGDFAEATSEATPDSFVYFDPPYDGQENSAFTRYQAGGFDKGEQIRLFETFDKLAKRGVKCLLSNADTPFIRDLYRDYPIDVVSAARAINSDASKRGKVGEVLIRSYEIPLAHSDVKAAKQAEPLGLTP